MSIFNSKKAFSNFIFILFMSFSISCQAIGHTSGKLPKGFVYLSDIDTTIIQHLAYNTKDNYIGERIPGYHTNKVIMTYDAAVALSRAQKEFLKDGYSLVVYDAYRPQRAVNFFETWAGTPETSPVLKRLYYPFVDKSRLFDLGYISSKSGHSRGATVDVSIIKVGQLFLPTPVLQQRKLTDGRVIDYLYDGTADMGVHFDYLDHLAHHTSTLGLTANQIQNRLYLRRIMENAGFTAYEKEWWHYTLKHEPYPSTYFDFEVR